MSKEFLEALNITKATEKYTGIDLTISKQALVKAQEQQEENVRLKGQVKYLTEVATDFRDALKIIFEKYVDVDFIKSADNFEEYNKLIKFKVFLPLELTEEEFNLVKRYANE